MCGEWVRVRRQGDKLDGRLYFNHADETKKGGEAGCTASLRMPVGAQNPKQVNEIWKNIPLTFCDFETKKPLNVNVNDEQPEKGKDDVEPVQEKSGNDFFENLFG